MKIKKKQTKIIALTAFSLVVLYWIGTRIVNILEPRLKSMCENWLRDEQMMKFGDQIAVVDVEEVKTNSMTRRVNTIGKLRAKAIIELKTEIPARIEEFVVKDGAPAKKGEVLIRLDKRETEAKLKSEQATYEFRKKEYDRIKELSEKSFESKRKMEEAKSAIDVSLARIEELQVMLSKLEISAPFDGTMGITEASRGSYVQSNQVIGSFVDNSFMHVDFKIPEKYIHDVGAGQIVEVRLNAFPNQIFQGTVEAVEPKSESESHSVKVRCVLENFQGQLRHGMFCNVSLIIGEKANAISVEEQAVENEGEVEFVWVVEKGKAMKRRVMTGTREKGRIEIISGISEGEQVITTGHIKLYPGIKVQINNAPEENLKTPEGLKSVLDTKQQSPVSKTAGNIAEQSSSTASKNSDVEKE